MYAVVETGGKQYKVAAGQTVRVEKLEGDKGSEVTLDKVLLVAGEGKVQVGAPYVSGVTVKATIVEQHRSRKVTHFHYKPKKAIRIKRGHRQPYTALRIDSVKA
ncbi:50S ribosomal protein L21 [bacterium]|nr:50S ribosomal protein L21 [bacterium]